MAFFEGFYIFLALMFLAEIVGTVGGFGSSVFFVPIASYFFDFQTVLGVTAIYHLFSNLSKIALFKKSIDYALSFKIGLPSVVFVVAGAFLSSLLPAFWLQFFLNSLLVIFSLFFAFNESVKQSFSNVQLYLTGSLSGFLAGLLGTGVAIRGLALASLQLQKNVFVATSAFIDFFIDASRSAIYASKGFVSKKELILLPFMFVLSLAGTYAGKLLLNSLPETFFRKFVLFLLFGIGVWGFYRQFFN